MGVMNHLTEQEIQDLADGLETDGQGEKRKHLGQCPECMKLFDFYRSLCQAVKSDDGFQLSPQFSSRVASVIVSEKEKQSRFFEMLLTGGCIFLGIIISLFYMFRSGLMDRWAENVPTLNLPQVDFGSQQPVIFLFYILVILIMFQAADKMLIHRKIHGNV